MEILEILVTARKLRAVCQIKKKHGLLYLHDTCMLNPDAVEVIAGYAARKVMVDRSKCAKCKDMALASSEIEKKGK